MKPICIALIRLDKFHAFVGSHEPAFFVERNFNNILIFQGFGVNLHYKSAFVKFFQVAIDHPPLKISAAKFGISKYDASRHSIATIGKNSQQPHYTVFSSHIATIGSKVYINTESVRMTMNCASPRFRAHVCAIRRKQLSAFAYDSAKHDPERAGMRRLSCGISPTKTGARVCGTDASWGLRCRDMPTIDSHGLKPAVPFRIASKRSRCLPPEAAA